MGTTTSGDPATAAYASFGRFESHEHVDAGDFRADYLIWSPFGLLSIGRGKELAVQLGLYVVLFSAFGVIIGGFREDRVYLFAIAAFFATVAWSWLLFYNVKDWIREHNDRVDAARRKFLRLMDAQTASKAG